MALLDQFINYQSIRILENSGINTPTEPQISCVEQCLSESIQLMGMSIYLLDRAGNKNPSVLQMQQVSQDLGALIKKNETTHCENKPG